MFTDKIPGVLAALMLLLATPSFSQDFDDLYSDENQEKDSLSLSDRVYFGGDISLSFGSSFYFSTAPEVGYKFFPRLHGGIAGYYMYNASALYDYSVSVFGGRVYARPFLFRKLFLQVEYEMLNTPRWDNTYGFTDHRIWVPGFLGGIGYMEKSSGRLGFYVSIHYNFIITDDTPYNNPVIRTGFIF